MQPQNKQLPQLPQLPHSFIAYTPTSMLLFNIYGILNFNYREQSLGTRRKAMQGIASRSFPLLNPKKAIEFPDINNCDKIFAAWYA